MWPFTRRRRTEVELLDRLLQTQADIALKRQEIELKREELNLANVERQTKATIDIEEARQRLRQQKAEWARRARERLAQRRAATPGQPLERAECRVCQGVMNVTAEEIFAHREHMGWAAPSPSNGGPVGVIN